MLFQTSWIHASGPRRRGKAASFRRVVAFEVHAIHVGLDPGEVSGDPRVDAGLPFFSTAVPPADNAVEDHPAVGLTDQRTPGIALKRQHQERRLHSPNAAMNVV